MSGSLNDLSKNSGLRRRKNKQKQMHGHSKSQEKPLSHTLNGMVNGEDDEDTMEALLDAKPHKSLPSKKRKTTFNFSTTCSDCQETFLSPYLLVLHQSTCQGEGEKKSHSLSKVPGKVESLKKVGKPHKKIDVKDDSKLSKIRSMTNSTRSLDEEGAKKKFPLKDEKMKNSEGDKIQSRINEHLKVKKKRVHAIKQE